MARGLRTALAFAAAVAAVAVFAAPAPALTEQPPSASFTPAGGYVAEGQAVAFGDTSTDAAGQISRESWTLGDGSPAGSGPTPTHTFTALGTYKVTLTITDTLGREASVSHQFTVL